MKRSRGGTPVVKKVVKNITINNIHNYFAPRPADGGEQHPPQLFPVLESVIRKADPHPTYKRDTYIRVQSKRSGVLYGECERCMNPSRPITDFAQADHVHTRRDRAAFFKANSDYTDAYAARDLEAARAARDRVDELRRAYCPPCVARMAKLSPAVQACKDEWMQMRKDACERHDGCMKDGCPLKGNQRDWRVLQADHVDPADKVFHLSGYKWWSGNGGVPAMRLEAAKCQWICGFCHFLESTSASGRRNGNPDDMECGNVSKYATKEEQNQYHAWRDARIRYPKHQYIDKEKLKRGCCAKCKRSVTPETCVAFQFDHIDETTKMIGKDTLAGETGGVGGLTANHAKCAALDEIKDVIDAEMDKCQLLCANCHKLKSWDGGDGGVDGSDEGEDVADDNDQY